MVGLNRFALGPDDREDAYEPLHPNPAIEAEQRERLVALRASRDSAEVDKALAALRSAASGTTENVLYPMKDALRARATVGEVCDALREIWGIYRPPDTF